MNSTQLNFLKSLCETPTPTGYETAGQNIVADYVKPFADRVAVDCHGNLRAVINEGANIRVMLDAHCDEIALMVQHIDDKGFIFVQPIGGVNVQLLPGERVVFHTSAGAVRGVFGRKAIHLMNERERSSGVSDITDLWVDIGSSSKAETEEVLPLGSIGIVESGWRELRNGLVSCRAFDDRCGVYVVMEALRLLKERNLSVEVNAVSSTQEEVGLLGATTAAFGIDPHYGIAVDVTFASDDPGGEPKKTSVIKLGGGPVLGIGPTYDAGLCATIKNAATSSSTPLQIQPRNRGNSTDAFAIRHTRAGVRVAMVSIPLRYMHSAVETISLYDLEKSATLIADAVALIKE